MSGTLGLGLASVVVLGGIAWRVWLRPLPFPDSEKLVRIYELGRPDAEGARDRGRISPPLLRDLRARAWSHFVDFAGVVRSTPEWVVDGDLRQLRGSVVTPGFFETLGLPALHGATAFTGRTGDEVPEVILSEAFWRQNFGADASVVGSSMDLGGVRHDILGVVALDGGYPEAVDVFIPLVFEERQLGEGMRGARYLEVVARVRAGSTIEAGTLELAAFVESLGPDHPIHDGWTGEAVSLREDLAGPFRDVLRLLLAAGAAFLALALVNVAGLGSTRALERSHELGIRRALGASRGRLARAAWVEGMLLGGLGGAAAIAFAVVLLPSSVGWLPPDLARSGQVGLSPAGALAWWLLAVSVGGAVSVLGQRAVPVTARIDGGSRTTRDTRSGRLLVAGQLALTTLLVGVGTLVLERSLRLAEHDFGFEPEGVYSGFVTLPRSTHDDWQARRDSWGQIVASLADTGIPAAITTNPPMSGMNSNYGFARPGDEHESFGQYAVVS
ncbi:MAG TPA: ABC transporter permease, partial [Longimicrobiales bacterium]|nr:ABC transporter permease [Longimicrobiales bacterium]